MVDHDEESGVKAGNSNVAPGATRIDEDRRSRLVRKARAEEEDDLGDGAH